MTVYLAFNEAEGLDSVTNITSSPLTVVAGVSRAGFRFDSVTATTTPSVTATMVSPLTEGWVHVLLKTEARVGNLANEIFSILDTSGAAIVTIKNTSASASGITANTPNSTGIAIAPTPTEGLKTIDINLRLSTTTGFVKIYVGGTLVHEETGVDTTVTSGVTQFDTLKFRESGNSALSITNDSSAVGWSQVIVSDMVTVGGRLWTLTPTAGSINTWDAGAITDVDETNVNDSDKAATTTNGDEFTMDTSTTLSAPTFPNGFSAVVQTFRASYDTGSPVTKFSPMLNDTTSTSTHYGTSQSLTTGLAQYKQIWNTDPADAGSWTASKINNYEFGIRADT